MINHLISFTDPFNALVKQHHKMQQMSGLPATLQALLAPPLSDGEEPLSTTDILVLDLETSGLNPHTDHILSMGMVTIHQLKIYLNSSKHYFIANPLSIKAETAVINHITPEQLKQGLLPSQAIECFTEQARGKIILAHGAAIEKSFLSHAMGIKTLPLIWLDTLMIEKSLSCNQGKTGGDYSLSYLRKLYGLPAYNAHNALTDAIATAELFLVQLKRIFPSALPTVKPLYRRSIKAMA